MGGPVLAAAADGPLPSGRWWAGAGFDDRTSCARAPPVLASPTTTASSIASAAGSDDEDVVKLPSQPLLVASVLALHRSDPSVGGQVRRRRCFLKPTSTVTAAPLLALYKGTLPLCVVLVINDNPYGLMFY